VKDNSLTGADIKDIRSRDIKDGSIRLRDLNTEVRKAIASGNVPVSGSSIGAPGANGTNGAPGAAGQSGRDATSSSGNWGVQSRNVLGSPDIGLRGGPANPPLGSGSLKFLVGSGSEKAAYGNEQDFFGQPVSGLTDVGFRVYTTGENAALGSPNMPSILFEVDPNLNPATTATNFSSLVFVPNNSASNGWSPYIDATQATSGSWFMTGAAGTATGCNLTTTCSFALMQSRLADGGDAATILTLGVTKGRDFAWQGAIDGLRINSQVFDFESNGVTAGIA